MYKNKLFYETLDRVLVFLEHVQSNSVQDLTTSTHSAVQRLPRINAEDRRILDQQSGIHQSDYTQHERSLVPRRLPPMYRNLL
jgi:hypothetical protein